ncbi:MAG: hypothetical protein ACLP9Y_34340 [Mycobacterium sp.]
MRRDDEAGNLDDIEQLPVDDWADQDLLTKDQARSRLVAEIGRTQARLDGLKATNADAAEITALARRLDAMESIRSEYDDYLDGK